MFLIAPLGVSVLFSLFYISMRGWFPQWGNVERKFFIMNGSWAYVFLLGGGVGALISFIMNSTTNIGYFASIIVGFVVGMLIVMGVCDVRENRVPRELSDLATQFSIVLGLGVLIIQALEVTTLSVVSETVTTPIYLFLSGNHLFWLLGGGVCAVLGTLGLIYSRSVIAVVSATIGALGLSLVLYIILRGAGSLFGGESSFLGALFVGNFFGILFFLVAVAYFELAAGGKMGGADFKAIYFVGWGLGAIVGPGWLFISIGVAAVLQLILHIVAIFFPHALPSVGIGQLKTVPYNKKRQARVDTRWEKEKYSGRPPTTYDSTALPFLPMLAFAFSTIVLIAISGMVKIL